MTERMHVLIVEDEARLRDVLAAGIADMGFHPVPVKSAEEAMVVLQRIEFDIAVVDLNLPGMNGLELFDQVVRSSPGTSVIIMTAYGNLQTAQQAIRLGVVDFLSKPTGLGDLELALDRARKKRMHYLTEIQPRPIETVSAKTVDETPATLEDIERECILEAIERNNGNRTAAAAELGISVRTLYYRLANYQKTIDRPP